jgi:hypothetical protein
VDGVGVAIVKSEGAQARIVEVWKMIPSFDYRHWERVIIAQHVRLSVSEGRKLQSVEARREGSCESCLGIFHQRSCQSKSMLADVIVHTQNSPRALRCIIVETDIIYRYIANTFGYHVRNASHDQNPKPHSICMCTSLGRRDLNPPPVS